MSERPSLVYRFLHGLFRLVIALGMRLDARGFERIPMEGPLLLTTNHTSLYEAPMVLALSPRQPLSALAKKEWEGTLLGRLIIDHINPVYVNREEMDRQALMAMMRRLKAGEAFGIAPEGTRSADGTLQEGKEGTAYLASRTSAQIVPVAVWGHEALLDHWKRLKRPLVHIRLGEPYRLEDDPALSRRENLERHTERIMVEIARMLPPERRGYYAGSVLGPPAA